MSFVVSVALTVAEGDTTLVQVVRGETVMSVNPSGLGESAGYQEAADTASLCQMVMDRLLTEGHEIANEQIMQLRDLLERLAGGEG